MSKQSSIDYKDPIIVGLGASGMSVARYFHGSGQSFTVIDSSEKPAALAELQQLDTNIPCILGEIPEQRLLQADLLVIAPGIDLETPALMRAKDAGVPMIGDIGLFMQNITKPVIAVTGTNGKSTVCAALGHILASAGFKVGVAGNIGAPALDFLDQSQVDYYILELSSFQLDLINNLQAKVALCLNISPDHLDRHHTMQCYLSAKQRIYDSCENAVVNLDQVEIWEKLNLPQNVVGFSINKNNCSTKLSAVCGLNDVGFNSQNNTESYLMLGSDPYMPLSELSPGLAAVPQNALAVLAVLTALKIDLATAKTGFKSFTALAHRCQQVHVKNHGGDQSLDLQWYNDSKATNVGAAATAMQSIYNKNKQKMIWIAGGQAKGVDLQSLRSSIQKYVAAMVLIGADAQLFADLAVECTDVVFATDMDDVVKKAATLASKHSVDTVLLAPACASKDQYENFKDRGDKFEAAINKLVKAK